MQSKWSSCPWKSLTSGASSTTMTGGGAEVKEGGVGEQEGGTRGGVGGTGEQGKFT